MTTPDPEAMLRARLAGALLQPSPEQLDRWQAAVDAARASAVRASSVRASSVRAGTAPPTGPTEVEPTEVEPTGIEPTGIEPTGVSVPENATSDSTDGLADDAMPAPRLRLVPGHRPEVDHERQSGPRPVRRRRTAGIAVAGLAAAVAATAWVGLTPPAGPQDRPLTLTREQLTTNLPAGRDFGELADPGTRTTCLARLGVVAREPLAGRPILLDDRPGVLLVLPTDRPGRLRVLVVSSTCANILADATTG